AGPAVPAVPAPPAVRCPGAASLSCSPGSGATTAAPHPHRSQENCEDDPSRPASAFHAAPLSNHRAREDQRPHALTRRIPRRSDHCALNILTIWRNATALVPDRLLDLFLAVEAEHLLLALDDRQQVDRPPPDAHQRGDRRARVVDLQVGPLVAVPHQQLAAVVVVGVLDEDERVAEVRQREQHLVLDLLELARVDLVVAGAIVQREREEPVPLAEVGGEELVDEGDVVVQLPDLEDLLAAQPQPLVPRPPLIEVLALVPLAPEPSLVQALLDVAQQLDADLVRVELPRRGREHAGVVVSVVDDLADLELALRNDPAVRVGVPALIEDLGLPLRREVVGLVAHDLQDVAL